MTPRTICETAQRPYLDAQNWVSTGYQSADWKGDDRNTALALVGAIICGLGILAVLIF